MGSVRAGYALAGLGVGAAVDLLVNLLAAAIQKRWFGDQFSSQSMWLLGGVYSGGAAGGLRVGRTGAELRAGRRAVGGDRGRRDREGDAVAELAKLREAARQRH